MLRSYSSKYFNISGRPSTGDTALLGKGGNDKISFVVESSEDQVNKQWAPGKLVIGQLYSWLMVGFFEPAQQDWASLSQLEPAWAGKLNAVSWAWNSAQAGSIINFQIKLSSSWLNALSWRFSSAQAGSTIELGWVSLSQVELAQPGSSWIPKKGGKMTFLVKKWHS